MGVTIRRVKNILKGIMLGFAFVCAGVFSSCALLNHEPELVADVYYAESESYYGTFGLGVELKNTGYGDAVDLNYGLFILGSNGSLVLYSLSEEYSDIVYTVEAKSTEYTSFIGVTDMYVPYSYELFIEWEDNQGNTYGPILVEGDFTLDSRSISELKKSNLPPIETIFKEHKMMTVPEKSR